MELAESHEVDSNFSFEKWLYEIIGHAESFPIVSMVNLAASTSKLYPECAV